MIFVSRTDEKPRHRIIKVHDFESGHEKQIVRAIAHNHSFTGIRFRLSPDDEWNALYQG